MRLMIEGDRLSEGSTAVRGVQMSIPRYGISIRGLFGSDLRHVSQVDTSMKDFVQSIAQLLLYNCFQKAQAA